MGGLNTALSIATDALNAQEVAISTADNNIANADTPGYSREVVNLSAAGTTTEGGVAVGDGVDVDGITSVRDQLVDLQIQGQTSAQTAANAQSAVLDTVQTYVSGSSATVGSDMSAFFTSLSALSSAPSNGADRETVISNAQDLVSAFQTTSQGLTSTQSGLDTQVSGDVSQINSLASQIASLNTQISSQPEDASGSGELEDQQSELEQQLSGLTSFSVTTTAQGDTISIGNDSPIVVGGQSYALSTGVGSNGLTQVVDSQGNTITSQISGGDLGGTITARDQQIPGFLSQLDTLANGFATAFNAAQSSGYDLDGNPGGALFTVPSTVAGSAASIALNTTNGDAIAVSSDGSVDGNGNLAALTAVQTTALPSGESPTDSYAALVDSIGNAASNASTQSTAIQSSLTQLTNLQSSVSGVSIDEESSNLIAYQQAYEAAAEVVSTINSLFSDTMDMMSTTGV